jgi:hypothetical protein
MNRMNSTAKLTLATIAGISLVMSMTPMPFFQAAYANRTGTEGCTPGYWKNHPEEWDEASEAIHVLVDGDDKYLTTDTLVRDAFDVDFLDNYNSYDSLTLLQALNLNGGGLDALLRAGVAALLNSGETPDGEPVIDYSLTDDQVYDRVRDGLDPQYVENLLEFDDENDTETKKNFLDAANNGAGGCPLN